MVFREFRYPEDYQRKTLEAHRKLQSAYDDTGKQKEALQNSLQRLKDIYRWGHISKEEYLAEYEEVQHELDKLVPVEDKGEVLEKLVHFLANVADAWKEASQEQRNKLARALFEQIQIEDKRVVFVKPRPGLRPFFKINFECHTRDSGCDPEGVRGLIFNICELACSQLSCFIPLALATSFHHQYGLN